MLKHRTMHFEAPGYVVYDPHRGKDKNGKSIIDEGRVVIQIPCFDIFDYYSRQFYKKFGIKLIRPSWEPHITVFANHKYSRNKKHPWRYNHGKKVMVQYSHYMFWNTEHVWLAATAPEVDEIRNNYMNHGHDLGHITIGKFHPDDVGKLPVFKKFEDEHLWIGYPNNPII